MFFFYRVDVAVFPDPTATKQLWYGKVPVLAKSVEDARDKAIKLALDSPEVRDKIKNYPNHQARVFSMARSRQVFK